MAIDHSLTYKTKGWKNYLHKVRLKKILNILDAQNFTSTYSYLDIGCSNGYLTDLIARRFNFSISKGMDHNNENLSVAQNQYDDLKFEYIDLNKPIADRAERYDVITCFETLEHVGNLENAMKQILSFVKSDGSFVLLSVPIEIGFAGIVKYIIKTISGYSLKELKNGTTHLSYFTHLIANKNISRFRDMRDGWGTHYGFDYREVDRALTESKCVFKSKNYRSTKFYIIQTAMIDV